MGPCAPLTPIPGAFRVRGGLNRSCPPDVAAFRYWRRPVRGGAVVKAGGCPGRAPGLCSPGVQRVKCGGAGAAGRRARGTARTRPSEGKLSRSPRGWIPVPEAAHGAAGCTRAGAVGGRPARAPSKRGAHARESGRCQPGEVGAGAEEPGALPAVGRRAGSRRSLSQVRGGFAQRIHPAGARTGARECSHAHARLRQPHHHPGQAACPGLGWAQGGGRAASHQR